MKQGILFGLNRSLVCLSACVCLGHTPLPIAIEFGTNFNGTNLEGRVFKNFLFRFHFKMVAVVCYFFTVTVKRIAHFSRNLDSLDTIFMKPFNLSSL